LIHQIRLSQFNSIVNNKISNNSNNGIHVKSSNNIFINNNISNNNHGIYFFTDSSNNNLLYHNNLINNLINAFDGGTNTWYNTTLQEGNYWDDYIGSDSNGDGIGDTPYDISGGSNQDLYPLIHPYGSVINLDSGEIFPSIQDAIDDSDTLAGHTIYVKNGTYYENVDVDKTINLTGEDRNSTIIDGGGNGYVVDVNADCISISPFFVKE